MPVKSTCALLIYPKFVGESFWNYRDTCKVIGAKYTAAPLGLVTVAAMLPEDWDLRLVDRNTGRVTEEDFAWADLVMVGAMFPQYFDALQVIKESRARGVPVVVGGPDPTSRPEFYALADFAVLGEAEGAIDKFIEDWNAGKRSGRYISPKFQVDVTKTPIPRYDLLKFEDYIFVGVQFSRGCPFTCEFCDIIELYGRVPRAKRFEQMLAELDRLYALGYRGHVDFVDDNLIGNKKAVKQFLPLLIEWQKEHNFPFEFSTEASLNLADDRALLRMLAAARFFVVFIGIESPDDDVLKATLKKQNTRRDIPENIHRIHNAGLAVIAGFIVGFDSEKNSVADAMTQLITQSAIPVAMVGLLYALPNTQLSRRLTVEGRLQKPDIGFDDLQLGDQCTMGLNFETRRPRSEILKDYRDVVEDIYETPAYFSRVRQSCLALRIRPCRGTLNMSKIGKDVRRFLSIATAMTFKLPMYRGHFWKLLLELLIRNPMSLKAAVYMIGFYIHLGPFSKFVVGAIDARIARLGDGSEPEMEFVSADTPLMSDMAETTADAGIR